MTERAFVMIPLAEIEPELELDGRTASAIAAKLDQAGISKVTAGREWWLA